jgi:hypothetical protein
MSRKDYRMVAASIREVVEMGNSFAARGDANWRGTAMEELVSTMVRVFKADNAAFKADTFRSVCGMEE